jgi:septal ring factor EnvC (AmiA/AmiB activator)
MTTARRYLACAVAVFLVSPFLIHPLRAETSPKREQLTKELAKVRSDIEAAQESISAQSKALWKTQHDLEYNDPSISKLREEITELEKVLVTKRQELNLKLSLIPERTSIDLKRRDLFTNLQNLKATEQAIVNEITALDNAAGVGK